MNQKKKNNQKRPQNLCEYFSGRQAWNASWNAIKLAKTSNTIEIAAAAIAAAPNNARFKFFLFNNWK